MAVHSPIKKNPQVALMELEMEYSFLQAELNKYKDIALKNGCSSPEELNEFINGHFWRNSK